MTSYPQIIPTDNPFRPLAARPTREVKPRLWLLVLATCTTLTFGVRPQQPLLATLLWAIRLGGAACAIAALYRDPEVEIYDPIAEATALHQFQMTRLQEQHQATLQQQQWEIQQYYDAQATQQIQSTIDYYAKLLQQKEYELLQLRQSLANQQIEFETEKQRLTQSWQSQWERLEVQTAELEATKNQLKAERDAIHAWAEEKAVELDAAERDARSQLSARAAKLEQDLDNQRKLLIEEFEKQHHALVAAAQKEIDRYRQLIADQEATIESQRLYIYNLQQPQYVEGTTTEELLADRVIAYLYEQGIIVRSPLVTPYGKAKFRLSFGILVIAPGKNEKVKYAESLIDAYKRLERVKEGIRGVVPGCRTMPELELLHRQIRLTIDTSGVDWEAEARRAAEAIAEPPQEHFELFVESCYHIGLFGPTRMGKTVCINNILAIMQRRLGGNAELIVGDAKLSTALKVLKPRYLGAKECLKGLREAADEVQRRIELREADYRNDRPLREFDEDQRIYFFDEINEVISRFNQPVDPDDIEWLKDHDFPPKFAVSTYLLRLWRMGAELGVLTLIAGQNLMANQLKINVVDLENLGLLFMGGAISIGINYRCKGTEKSDLEAQYRLRRERYFKTKDKQYRYYGLFALPNEQPYLAQMPTPDAYLSTFTIPLLEATETDEDEESEFLENELTQTQLDEDDRSVQDIETLGADFGADGADAGADSAGSGAAPDGTSPAPEVVRRLEDLLHQDFTGAHPTDHASGAAPENPLAPGISPALVQRVLVQYDQLQNQSKVIEKVWGTPRSGTSIKYLAAKWKFRKILYENGRKLPGKAWGEDPNDWKSFDELIGGEPS
ncbi:hypothetical protein [Leptolyngbya ohadii]|uniref:hypothetical protein n=1 Tax=Leptolyngbya ohadii TaxID=1962290 RepID=UPI000B59DC7A|nr:hypothetical protein [Leptolyngbya ohadii]